MCRSYKSGNGCIYGKRCLVTHADGEEKPSKRSRKEGTPGAVAILREKQVQGCVSQNPDLQESVPRKAEQVRLNASAGHTINSQDAPGTKFEFGKEKGHLQELSKKENLMSETLARPSLRKEHLRKPQEKKIVPAKQRGTWRKYIHAQTRSQSYVSFSCENKGTSSRLQKHRRSNVCCRFGSFNARAEQERFKLR